VRAGGAAHSSERQEVVDGSEGAALVVGREGVRCAAAAAAAASRVRSAALTPPRLINAILPLPPSLRCGSAAASLCPQRRARPRLAAEHADHPACRTQRALPMPRRALVCPASRRSWRARGAATAHSSRLDARARTAALHPDEPPARRRARARPDAISLRCSALPSAASGGRRSGRQQQALIRSPPVRWVFAWSDVGVTNLGERRATRRGAGEVRPHGGAAAMAPSAELASLPSPSQSSLAAARARLRGLCKEQRPTSHRFHARLAEVRHGGAAVPSGGLRRGKGVPRP
jgi:hypothetical protein